MPEPTNSQTATRSLLLVLHDVAPHTWPDYQPFVEAVDALGNIPLTWLVVPDFHKRDPLAQATDFRRMLDRRLQRGDELVLHGYFHLDDSPPPRSPGNYFMRRIYTHEGEFYSLDRATALERLQAGMALFESFDWPVAGFVAPAWLMGEGTRQALGSVPLQYTSDPRYLYRLPGFSALAAPGLVWSARSAWRRGLSRIACDLQAARLEQAPVIRLGLHPVDMRHRASRQYWMRTLQRLLQQGRTPLTKSAWLAGRPSS
ncbi:polysaccharide deacetylase family protein [Pseudomonas sp. GD03860]|uniref:polysaccharide deacetylase family protein n=1 Tax=Pseudomonas TaxID=286 RepID=UPI0023633A4C|nr:MULTISPECIES: polysaccharide deacetylase family protein [Pseudomonas]MDD2057559.1 polysaccharide deacetylase family protein [Pseudomonas putida]MDH0635873.1 polysaccharide deacetylase family protein [Pseudomonas sp. GD03860]